MLEDLILQSHHLLRVVFALFVVEAEQMKQAMQNHVGGFIQQAEFMLFCLPFENFRAQHELTDRFGVFGFETQHIGGIVFLPVGPIDLLGIVRLQEDERELLLGLVRGKNLALLEFTGDLAHPGF